MNTSSAASPTSSPVKSFDSTPSVPDRKIPAWLLSFGFHAVMFVLIVVMFSRIPRGAGDVETRAGGIVLVDVTSDTTEYLSEGDNSDSSSSASVQQSPPPLPSESELPPELPGLASAPSQVTGIGDDLLESFQGADSLLDGKESFDIGGKVTTEVFGVKGTGSRFLYIFDRSESMEGYDRRPLLAAKSALKTSLESLGKVQQFQIVFYNDKIRVLEISGEPTAMFFATDVNKNSGSRFVDSISGSGGTDHLAALKYGLSLGPDVIFLLTDAEGGFTPAEMGAISDWNRGGTVINAIEFGVGSKGRSDDNSLERVARESGGQYTYKNILTLQVDR